VSLLEVDDLVVAFTGDGDTRRRGGTTAEVRAVDGVGFDVDTGERVALVGESGSGKTLTALAVMGLVDPPGRIAGGRIALDGRDLVGLAEREYRLVRGARVGMVFQDPMTALNPAQRVGDQVAEAVLVHDRAASRADARRRAHELLEQVRLPGGATRARDYPHQLSGGMRQRVMLAIALANHPALLIADEPTTALDVTTQAQILDLLDELRRELGMAVLLITHDLGVVAGHADRVVVMYAGRVVEEAPADALFRAPRHPYTRGLVASSPGVSDARGALTAIPGQPPSPGAIPSGCAFHPRCAFAEARCEEVVPPLEVLAPGRSVACVRVHELPSGPS
jgi:oligopeptide/dipeptide ABC transporter ATP-binding protein